MERQEPRIDPDMAGIEFRVPSRRGRMPPRRGDRADALAVKIGIAVGAGVLTALLVFNAYERYQARRDAEEVARVLNAEMEKLGREFAAAANTARARERPVRTIHPVPPGYRCANGVLLHRDQNGWTQITQRSRHVYCPHGGTVNDCHPVTPRSVGCGS